MGWCIKKMHISIHFPMIVLIFIILFFFIGSVKVRGPEIHVHKWTLDILEMP